MKTLFEEALRGVTIIACGGYGLWLLITGGYHFFFNWNGDLAFTLFPLISLFLITVPLLAVAYFCLRRQYRKIFYVIGVIGCIFIYGILLTLPEWTGYDQYVRNHGLTDQTGMEHTAFPISLFCLFGSIFIAAWFCRLCFYFANRGTEGYNPWRKTHATRWLVWWGLLLMLGSFLAIMIGFSLMTPSSTSAESSGSAFGWMFCCVSLNMAGTAMMIAGLAWRRPVVEQLERTVVSNDETGSKAESPDNS